MMTGDFGGETRVIPEYKSFTLGLSCNRDSCLNGYTGDFFSLHENECFASDRWSWGNEGCASTFEYCN